MNTLSQPAPAEQLVPLQGCVECRISKADRMLVEARARLREIDPYANPKQYDRLYTAEQTLLRMLAPLRTLAGLSSERCEEHAK